MTDKNVWESVKAEGGAVLDKLRDIIHEGSVRRVRVRQGERVIAEFPLTAGLVGVVLAPVLAAVATIVALAKDCAIDIQRDPSSSAAAEEQSTPAA